MAQTSVEICYRWSYLAADVSPSCSCTISEEQEADAESDDGERDEGHTDDNDGDSEKKRETIYWYSISDINLCLSSSLALTEKDYKLRVIYT